MLFWIFLGYVGIAASVSIGLMGAMRRRVAKARADHAISKQVATDLEEMLNELEARATPISLVMTGIAWPVIIVWVVRLKWSKGSRF